MVTDGCALLAQDYT